MENQFIKELKALTTEARIKSEDGKLTILEIAGFIDNFIRIFNATQTDDDLKIIFSDIRQTIENLKKEKA